MHTSTLVLLLVLVFVLVFVLVLSLRAVSRARVGRLQDYASAPPPSQIQSEIQAVPAMQQPHARQTYIGKTVRWQVTFEAVTVLSPFSVRLMLVDQEQYPWVWCTINKRKYPQINSLVQHTPLRVTGQISKITLNDIYLKNVQLEFEK